jgi:hypothetical protein
MTRSKIPTHGVQRLRLEAVSLVRRLGTRRADAFGGVLMLDPRLGTAALVRRLGTRCADAFGGVLMFD